MCRRVGGFAPSAKGNGLSFNCTKLSRTLTCTKPSRILP
nr:MAG TPA: hypothetical protein [Caudoviricetes sp.]